MFVISLPPPLLTIIRTTALTTKSIIAPLLFKTANNSVGQIVMIVAFKDMQQLSLCRMTELCKIPQLVSAPFKYHINCIGRDFTRNRQQLEHSYCKLVSVKYHVEEKVTDRGPSSRKPNIHRTNITTCAGLIQF